MSKYPGITKKTMSNGSTALMVRFKHLGITYPIKNFTTLFGSTTEKQAFDKLNEVKQMISEEKDPFASSISSLNQIFEERVALNLKNGIWANSTVKNYEYFYKNHIKSVIGRKKVEKIKYQDIMKILNKFTKTQAGSKNTVIDILKPIFKEEFNKGTIFINVMNKIDKYTVEVQKEELSKRTNLENTDIVKQLYKAIPLYSQAKKENIEQHQIFLYMLLMTAHRFGELNQLESKHCDIENRKIISPKEITKTNENYHFPIPDECLNYIKNHKGSKLFNIPRGGTASRLFHRLLIKAKITTIDNHSISMHDTRKLMLSIMVNKLNIDSRLADYCLDHKLQGTIKHYLEFTYEDKVKAYKKYWDFIRGVIEKEIVEEKHNEEIQVIKNDSSNFDKLKELVDMVKDGFLTKEEFEIEKNKLF